MKIPYFLVFASLVNSQKYPSDVGYAETDDGKKRAWGGKLSHGRFWKQAYEEVNSELKPLLDYAFPIFAAPLKEKWSVMASKWYKRYEEMSQHCQFDGRSLEMPTSNRTDVCQVYLNYRLRNENKSLLRPLLMRLKH